MKKLTYMIGVTVLLVALSLIGCKDDDDPSVLQVETQKLAATWVVSDENAAVTLDSYDVSSLFQDFELAIKPDNTFTTTGGTEPNLWPASGKWQFAVNSNGTTFNYGKFKRDDGLELTIRTLNQTQLKLTFQFDQSQHNGKVEGVSAEYAFSFVKK